MFADQSQTLELSPRKEDPGDEDGSSGDEAVLSGDQSQNGVDGTVDSEILSSQDSTNASLDHGSLISSRTSFPEVTLSPLALLSGSEQSPTMLHSDHNDSATSNGLVEVSTSNSRGPLPNLPDNLSPIRTETRLLPLKNDDAMLLRYFMTDLVSWVSVSPSNLAFLFLLRG